MKIKNWGKLVLAVLMTEAAGGIGAAATTPKIASWYAGLNKPFFNPPGWVFGPVWTILYLLMGVAFYLIWEDKSKEKIRAMKIFGVQLGLNMLWSFIFFGWEKPGWALVEIILLWASIMATIKSFGKMSRLAAKLLVPYLAWVSFATILNGAIYWLNR